MKKIFLSILFICSMFCVIGQPSTPLKDTTVGLFSSELDSITSVTGWSGINFQKILAGTSYGYISEGLFNGLPSTTFHGNVLNAGGMFNAGNIRIGVTYTGAIGNGSFFTTETTENKTSNISKLINDHNAFILVGLPIGDLNLGIRGGFNVSGNRENEEINSKDTMNKQTMAMRPSIMLGTSLKGANGWTITPTLNFGFTISDAWRTFATVSGDFYSSDLSTEILSYKAYTPSGELGIGVNFPVEEFSLSGQINYSFDYSFMPEKMSIQVLDDQSVEKHIYRTDERMKNTITIHTTGRKSLSDKLTLAARAYIQTSIDKWISGGTKERTPDTISPYQTTEQMDITVLPRLYLAGTYQMNEKVNLSAGVSFDPTTYTYIKSRKYDEGIITGTPKTDSSSHSFNAPLLSKLGFGMTFTPVQEFVVQLGVTLQSPQKWTSILDGDFRLSATWKK
ncbi:MAG: hypothetical protein IKW26_07390 [Treponema sp.]|nr:hypothetical protein [Treponema sp.]